jgi:hypothetical protein
MYSSATFVLTMCKGGKDRKIETVRRLLVPMALENGGVSFGQLAWARSDRA